MNKIATQDRSPASSVAISNSGLGAALRPESLGDVVRFAELMCQSKAGIPVYLHGNAADCMAITLQALQWEFNPFSVAQKSYKIKDVIAYEAQLIAAVVNTRADLKRRPLIEFEGEGEARKCFVTFEFRDGSTQVYESPAFGKITPKNSPLWKSDPDQQHSYYSIRAGARRFCPEVILGVYDRDEADQFRGPDRAKDITPIDDPLSDEPMAITRQQEAVSERYDAETGELTSDDNARSTVTTDNDDQDTGEADPSTDMPAQEDGEVSSPASSSSTNTNSAAPSSPAEQEGGEVSPPASSPSPLSDADHANLIECCRKMLAIPLDENLSPAEQRGILETTKDAWKGVLPPALHDKLKSMFMSTDAIIKGNADRDTAISLFSEMLGCQPNEIGGEA